MADMKQIYNFAIKWCYKFRNQNISYKELTDHHMADDCAALGFVMDCGQAFSERYGNASCNFEVLDEVIDDITDIPLLGSAIYSQWRYFNHWAYSCDEILLPQNRTWFILALSRLAILSGENPFIFKGTLKKIQIISNGICYGPMPAPEDEIEQHITINSQGRVWFSGFNYGDGVRQFPKGRSDTFSVNKNAVAGLFDAFASFFGNEYTETFTTDVGSWELLLTNTDGDTFKFMGSLCEDHYINGVDLSDLVRDTLGMDDLYVFDGNNKPDEIQRIMIKYHRTTKIKPKELPNDAEWEFVTWDYSEQLIIDRATETLEHIQNIGSQCKVSRKYEIGEGVSYFLDGFDADELFINVVGNPDDVIETPNETKEYEITIDYKKSPQRIIKGSFDKNGLPEDFDDFAEEVVDFIRFYGFGEILDPSIYRKTLHRANDYIYCSVTFDEGEKSYYYITDDDTIEIGDLVIVPAGKDNHEAIVEVVDIEYFDTNDVPLPVEKTKRIIRKYSEDDFQFSE